MPETELETRSPKVELISANSRRIPSAAPWPAAATAAEAVVREGDEFSTSVRLGQVETLKEAGSRAIGVRVFFGKRAASTYSSDFSREGLDRMLKSALSLAKITSEDPFGGIPDAAHSVRCPGIWISTTRTSIPFRGRTALNTRAGPRRRRSITTRAHQELRRRVL